MGERSVTTRRDLLKKGAAAGAIVWAAPIVSSTPAFAATGRCSGSKPCTTFYFVNFSPNGSCTGSDGSCTFPVIKDCAGKNATLLSGCDLPAATRPTGTINGPTTVGSISFPAGVIPIYFLGKLGSNCYLVNVIDDGNGNLSLSAPTPLPPACNDVEFELTGTAQSGYTISVTVGDTSNCGGAGGHGISHMSAAFCL